MTLDSQACQIILKASKDANKRSEATIDAVQITNDHYELMSNLRGNSTGGFFKKHNYRQAYGEADGSGWFSYDLEVNPHVNNYISTKYYSGDNGRKFDIYVDDKLLIEETIVSKDPANFYDVIYQIPNAWLVGKTTVTVKFANRGIGYVGRVFDQVSILKNYDQNATLANLTIDGTTPEIHNNTYKVVVDARKDEVEAKFTPASRFALVYVNGILINDTQSRSITLDHDPTSLNVRVVAADNETEEFYTIKITRG